MNYFQLHIGDYEKATAHLTAAEDGIYNRLLRRYYDTEQPIPADIKAVQRLVRARSKDERDAVETVLNEFFSITPDGWRHRRCDEEIEAYQAKKDKARSSANARWSKGGRNANASDESMRTHSERNANASESHCDGNANQEPITKKEQKQTSLGQQAARFAEFWAVYPNRKGKAAALRTWHRKRLDALADRIIADVQARIAGDRQWLDGYIPHGSTYVNGEGWLDAIEAPRLRAVAGTGYQPLPGEI